MPAMRMRITVSALVGLLAGAYCWFMLERTHGGGAGDFSWAIWAAQDLLSHRNPYDRPMQLYPLFCALFGLPFAWMRPSVAGGAFYGISSALLAFGLSRHGYHRLYVFLAYPYWAALYEAQWTPLILASAFLSALLPVTLAKPQLGLPILLTSSTKRGLLACVAAAALTFIIMPGWLGQWLSHLHRYSRFIPLLVLPGPLLALALIRFREREARFLIAAALMPQRWFYDGFILWFIPKSRREIIWTSFLSWGTGIWRWYYQPTSFIQVGRMCVLFFYLPMLAVVLLRSRPEPELAADQP
jgi:hypothetical protein